MSKKFTANEWLREVCRTIDGVAGLVNDREMAAEVIEHQVMSRTASVGIQIFLAKGKFNGSPRRQRLFFNHLNGIRRRLSHDPRFDHHPQVRQALLVQLDEPRHEMPVATQQVMALGQA